MSESILEIHISIADDKHIQTHCQARGLTLGDLGMAIALIEDMKQELLLQLKSQLITNARMNLSNDVKDFKVEDLK